MSSPSSVGWGLSILAGTFVLANVTHLAKGSVFAAAVWHFTYNAASGTEMGSTTQMVATILVMVWAVLLVVREWRRRPVSWLSVPPPPRTSKTVR